MRKLLARIFAAVKRPAVRRYRDGSYGDWKYGSSTK